MTTRPSLRASGRRTGDVVRCGRASHAVIRALGGAPGNYRVAADGQPAVRTARLDRRDRGARRAARRRGVHGRDAAGDDGDPGGGARRAVRAPAPARRDAELPARRSRCSARSRCSPRSGSRRRSPGAPGTRGSPRCSRCSRPRCWARSSLVKASGARRGERRRALGARGGGRLVDARRGARRAGAATASVARARRAGPPCHPRLGRGRRRRARGRALLRGARLDRPRRARRRARGGSRRHGDRRARSGSRSLVAGGAGCSTCSSSCAVLALVPDLLIFRPEAAAAGDLAAALETGIVQFHHDFLLGPANEVLHGHPMLAPTASQYGVTSIYLLAAWFQLAPIGYGTLGLLTGALTALWFGAGYGDPPPRGDRAAAERRPRSASRSSRSPTTSPIPSARCRSRARCGSGCRWRSSSARWSPRAGRSGPVRGMRAALVVLGLSAVWSLESFAYTAAVFAALACLRARLDAAPGARLRFARTRRGRRRARMRRGASRVRARHARRVRPRCPTGASTSSTCASSCSAPSATSPTTSSAGRPASWSAPATPSRRSRSPSWCAATASSCAGSARRSSR